MTHARVRTSESYSSSPSSSVELSENKVLESDNDCDLDARKLAKEISDYWGVQDPALVVAEFGIQSIATIHRRMKSMSRKQKLNHVENLGGYFMSCLIAPKAKPKAEPEEGSDEWFEAYKRRQRERGQNV